MRALDAVPRMERQRQARTHTSDLVGRSLCNVRQGSSGIRNTVSRINNEGKQHTLRRLQYRHATAVRCRGAG
jgi:hypothetical protein